MVKHSLRDDGRLLEVQRLSEMERDLTRQATAVSETIAGLVTSLLPPHAPESHVLEVVAASGYSRTFVDGVRGGRHPWHKTAARSAR